MDGARSPIQGIQGNGATLVPAPEGKRALGLRIPRGCLEPLLVLAVVLPAMRPAFAETPEESFREAENAFRFQDCPGAIARLRPLLYPEVTLTSLDLILKAREYLGACEFWTGNERAMEDEFMALLMLSPGHRLDAFYYPPTLIEKFEAIRRRLIDLHMIPSDAPEKPEPPPTPCERQEVQVTRRHWAPMLVPFGVGQFLNGQSTKGALFLTGEALTLGLNVGSYVAIESLRGSDGRFTAANARTARDLRISQYVGLGAFVALAVWGIVDAFHHFEPEESSVRMVPCPGPASSGSSLAPGISLCAKF